MSTTPLLDVAQDIEASLRSVPGVAGLDPQSRLSTTGVDGMVRGAAIRETGRTTDVALELVAREGQRLVEAGAAAREVALQRCRDHGHPEALVSVRFTDISPRDVPPVEVVARTAALSPPPPRKPAPAPEAPSLGPHVVTAPVPGTGSRTVLVITVEVREEPS